MIHYDSPDCWVKTGDALATDMRRVSVLSPPGVEVRLVNVEDGKPLPVDEHGDWLIDTARVIRYAVQYRGTGNGCITLEASKE